jgi:large subunit ribosomal protein L10e
MHPKFAKLVDGGRGNGSSFELNWKLECAHNFGKETRGRAAARITFIKPFFFCRIMAKLRKGRCYTTLERPYTRKSKYKALSYVRSAPVCKVTRFDSGSKTELPVKIVLVSKVDVQLRHNCIESARQVVQRILDRSIPGTDYHFKIKAYPHHHLRENPLASGAGADRMSTGMQKSFGKVIGLAARVHKGHEILEISTKPEHIAKAKNALRIANTKLPKSCQIVVKS